MGLGRVPLDEVVYFALPPIHSPSTLGLVNADSTPTFDVFEESTTTPILAAQNCTTFSVTGLYFLSFTASAANGFEVGKWYNVYVSATVESLADKALVATFMLVPAESSAGVTKVDVSHFGGSAGTFASGRPEVNTSHFGGSAGTFASGRPEVNASHWGGTAVASANVLIDGAITAAKIASDAIQAAKIQDGALTAAKFASGAFDAVWSVATRLLTAGTNIVLAKGVGVTGFNDLSAAQVNAEADTALSDYDPPTRAELTSDTNSILSKLLKYVQLLARKDAAIATDNSTELTAINADGGSGSGAYANTTDSHEAIRDNMGTPQTGDAYARLGAPAGATVSADIAAVKSDTAAILVDTGTTLDAKIDAIKAVTDKLDDTLEDDGGTYRFTANALEEAPTSGGPTAADIADAVWSEALPGSYASGEAGKIVGDNLNATVSSRATQASVDTLDDYVDAEVAAIKAKTDNLPASPAATGDIPTAVQNADALLGRNLAGGSNGGRMVKDALRASRNRTVINASTITVYQEDDTTPAWTGTATRADLDNLQEINPA